MAQPCADSTADLFAGTDRERAEAGALPADWKSTPLACTLEWLRRQRHDGEPYRPATIQKHLSIVRRYLASLDRQGSTLQHAGPEQIATFLDTLEHLQRDGTPALTRHRYLRTLELLHSELSHARLRSDNPARTLMQQYPAPRTRPLPESLTENEEARLLSAMQQAMALLPPGMAAVDAGADGGWRMLRDAAIVAMAIGSGLQPREIVALGRRDMHLDETPPFVTVAGYGRRPERVAPVSPSVRPLLDAWIGVRARLCTDAAGALFCATPRGEPLTVRTVHRACEAWLDRAGIDRTHKGARVLRGAFATRQLRAGKPARVLRDWMGLALEGSAAAYARGIVNPDGIEVA
jgi:site-specific recombinase XerD